MESIRHSNNNKIEFQVVHLTDDVARLNDVDVSVDIQPPAQLRQSWQQPARCIHRVPSHLRSNNNRHVYDPVVLSLGPYNQGKAQCREMEKIKSEVLNGFISDSLFNDETKDGGFYYREILESINQIRDNYDEGVSKYKDVALAEIIFRDACFLIRYMERKTSRIIHERLGMSTAVFIFQDVCMLENQIPFWIIKRMLTLRFGEGDTQKLVCEHLSFMSFWSYVVLKELPWGDDESQPLHLLEATRAALQKLEAPEKLNLDTTKPYHFLTKIINCKKIRKASDGQTSCIFKYVNLPFRSVTYLQGKGIRFQPSSICFKDIIFTSHSYYGMLHLPILCVCNDTKGFLPNLIAFEMSPGNPCEFVVTSYVNFMKSLFESPRDVKELRERGILFSTLGSDEEVVEVFKDINTYGLDDHDSFAHVKRNIDDHCNAKANTWITELIHNSFHSPWGIIAHFAATFLLCLSFLQTSFTIHPPKK